MARAALCVWLLTVFPALSAAQRPSFDPLTGKTTFPPPVLLRTSDETHCLYQDYGGFVWRCTDRGLVRFDGREEVTFVRGVSDLQAILRGSRDGQYWVGAASGLYQMRSSNAMAGAVRLERFVTEHQVAAVNGLVEFIDGSIGCATDDGALRLADGKVTEIPLGLPADRAGRIVHVLRETKFGDLLAGTSSGLYIRSRDGIRRFTVSDGLPDNDVQTIAVTGRRRIWIGTRRGLATIDLNDPQAHSPRPVRLFAEAAALRETDVRALRADDTDDLGFETSLWVGTSTRLVALKKLPSGSPEISQIADVSVRRFSYGGPDLLVATDDDLRVASGGLGGGRTVITGINVDGRSQPVPFEGSKHARLELPWYARVVEVRFAQPNAEMASTLVSSITGVSPYLIRTDRLSERKGTFSDIPELWTMLRWNDEGRIRGDIFVPLGLENPGARDRRWPRATGPVVLRRSLEDEPASSYVSKHVATADASGWLRMPHEAERRIVIEHPTRTLGAGLHRVVVYARNGRGVQGNSASVEFVVTEAPWVRWWFVGPLVVAIAGTGLVYRRHRHQREAEIVRLRTRIAADLHDSVGASLSRIAILSDVVASQVGEQIPKAGPSLKAIGDNARSVIDEMSDAVWFIDPGIRNVGNMLVRIRTVAAQLFEADGVAWSVDAEQRVLNLPLTSEQRRHIYLVVKEALTNVRRHAGPSFVAVRFVMAATGLRIEIDDDGRMAIPISGERRGNGVANMQARAAELGGTFAVEPRLPAPGTRVVVKTNLR
jgi:hypothetical protein